MERYQSSFIIGTPPPEEYADCPLVTSEKVLQDP